MLRNIDRLYSFMYVCIYIYVNVHTIAFTRAIDERGPNRDSISLERTAGRPTLVSPQISDSV
jgi:hypothetical protein